MTTKSKIQPRPLAPDDWDPALTSILQDMKGRPLNVHSLMAQHPQLLQAWWSFRNYSVAGGALGRRAGELVILRTAVHMRAWYEWASHVERGLACGLTLVEIEAVKEADPPNDWSQADRLVLQAVDELFSTQALSEDCLAQMAPHFSPQQVMDIMAIHGMYYILGCMINSWGLDLDAHVREKLPPSVTRNAFEASLPHPKS